jgi:prepilin-type N-terminal cleavage/methylation domain-containing protein
MIRFHRSSHRHAGFSLIEVLIAVVVLATGLLALAALQASLTRSSAEAKARGRVAAMLDARMDELRSAGYTQPILDPHLRTATTCNAGNPAWLCSAQSQASIGSLTVYETIRTYSSAPGGSSFTLVAIGSTPAASDAQFKRVNLEAEWQDSDGGAVRHVGMDSEFSQLAFASTSIPTPDPNGSSSASPVVRQDDPTVAGMIPIAMGNGSESAATNPKPIVVGRNNTLIETKFNVLTYTPSSGAVQVQQRVETTVVGCRCKYGNESRLTGIYTQNFRPTYWDGNKYTSPSLIDVSNSSLRPIAGPVGDGSTDRTNPQSDLCTDCCRDHRDASGDTVKFDPFRSGAHDHYSSSNLSAVVTVASKGEYNEACRVIRVDGFWRVATDARIEHFDYIGTGPATSDQAPDPTYEGYYTTFVVDYLRNRFVGPDDGVTAEARYALAPAKHPASITIIAGDKRYQHTHAILVDHIEPAAQSKIDAQVANCTKTDKADCILPYIPFTTINLTELSHYVPSNASVISVLDGGANFNDLTAIQGMVTGLSTAPTGTNTPTSDATVKVSNTALAGILPIDPDDATLKPTAQQTYSLTNGTPTTGDNFSVNLTPAFATMNDGTSNNDPGVRWSTTASPGLTNCPANSASATNPYTCTNPSGFGAGTPTTVTLSGYNGYQDGTQGGVVGTCKASKKNDPDVPYTTTSSDVVRICKNYQVSAVTLSGTIGSPTSSGLQAEQTSIAFPSIAAGNSATITFIPEADTYKFTCTYKVTGNTTTYTVVPGVCP